MKIGLIGFLLVLFLVGCSTSKADFNISKEETLKKIIAEDNYLIVDVRTVEEYKEGHVVNALLLPYDEIDESVALDKKKTIIVYCRSGRRSAIAAKQLKNMGYEVLDMGAYDTIPLAKE